MIIQLVGSAFIFGYNNKIGVSEKYNIYMFVTYIYIILTHEPLHLAAQ